MENIFRETYGRGKVWRIKIYGLRFKISVLIWEVPLWEILKVYFLIFRYPRQNQFFVGIIYRPPNSINFLECFNKHLDDINLNNEIFWLGDFNVNLLHNGKYILKENQAMENRIPSTSLVSQYTLFCQRYSLEQIIKHVTRTKCSSSTLIDHILTNSREKYHTMLL